MRTADLVGPAAAGLAAVAAAFLTAALLLPGLRLPGLRLFSAAGAPAGALRTAAVQARFGPIPLSLDGELRAVPVLVTAVTLLALAVTLRALPGERRDGRPPSVRALRAGIAAVTAAGGAALVAALGRVDVRLDQGAVGAVLDRPAAASGAAAGATGARPGPEGIVQFRADVPAALAGAFVLTLVAAAVVDRWHRPARAGALGGAGAAGTSRAALRARLPGAALAGVLLLLGVWSVTRPGLRPSLALLAVPDLVLVGLTRVAGVPWHLPGGVGAATGFGLPPASFGGSLAGLRLAVSALLVAAAVTRGVLLGRRPAGAVDPAAGPGRWTAAARRRDGLRVARYAAAGAATLLAATWLAAAEVTVRLPFGAVRAVGAHGDLLPAIVWGALWGALAGALVTVVVALACRNPAGEPARSPDGGPMADAGPVPATPAGTAAAGGQVGTHGREHEHRRH